MGVTAFSQLTKLKINVMSVTITVSKYEGTYYVNGKAVEVDQGHMISEPKLTPEELKTFKQYLRCFPVKNQ
tara:strand:- start:862 stop:1074 length:213 start_codon:yes stop_codon:yes gene_type:complete